MSSDFYSTIEKPVTAEYRDRGSKFTAYAYPVNTVDEFKAHLTKLKKEHPKAAHHCFAYRLGTDGNNFRVSDDGEPSGTAGRPILGQMDSKGLTDILIVVVRYFGGTLLGVPGLINAYKTSAALALQNASIVSRPVIIHFRIRFGYSLINEVMRLVRRYDCRVLKQDLQLFCILEIGIPKGQLEEATGKFRKLRGTELEIIK
jgi:uncharacterized YigZ family protein